MLFAGNLLIVCVEVCQECQPGQHRHPGQLTATEEQAEEGDPGEEAGEEGGQDSVCHPAGLHTHLDAVQCPGSHERHSGTRPERQDHPGDVVGHRL